MNQVTLVPAYFVAFGKVKSVKVPTGEKKAGFFGGEKNVVRKEQHWVQTGTSKSEIDNELLAQDLAEAVKKLNQEGFEIVSVTPVMSGDYNYDSHVGGSGDSSYGYGYGYGYSYTSSLILVSKMTDSPK